MRQSDGGANQQVTVAERAWLGGLFTGEGCACLSLASERNTVHGRKYIMVVMNMTDERAMAKASRIIAKAGIRHYRQVQPPRRTTYGYISKPQYRWNVQSLRTVRKFWDVFGEFIEGNKRDEFLIVLEYVDLALTHLASGMTRTGTDLDRIRREKFIECVERLRAFRDGNPRDQTRYSFGEINPNSEG